MKKIQMMGGKEIIVSDEEAGNIITASETAKFIQTRSGDFLNVSSISCIVDYKGIEIFGGNLVFESGNGEKYIRVKSWGNGDIVKRFLTTEENIKLEYRTQEQYDNFITKGKENLRLETEQKNKEIKEREEKYKREEEEKKAEKERWEALSEEDKNKELLENKEKELKMYEEGAKKNPEWSYFKENIIKTKKEIEELKIKINK